MTGFKIGAGVVIAAIGAAGLVAVAMPRPPAPTHKGDLSIEARIARETAAAARGIRTIPIERPGPAAPKDQARLLEPPAPAAPAPIKMAKETPPPPVEPDPPDEPPITAGPDVDRLPVRSWHWHEPQHRHHASGGDICSRHGGRKVERGRGWRCVYR